MKSKTGIIVAIIVIIIVIAGFAWWHHSHSVASTQSLQKVTISEAYEVFLYAPLYVAQQEGFFTKQGLDVNIITAGGDDKAFASLVSGDAQFAVGDPTFAAVAGDKGQPGTVIGAILTGVPFWGVAKSASIPAITSPVMLGNHKVATYPAPSTAFALQTAMFKAENVTPNITQIAPGGLLPALDAGKVDIALELEPNVSTAVKNGDHVVYSLSQYYPDFAITGLEVLPAYLQKNPETAQKVVNALQEADDYIRSNPDQVAAMLAAKFQVDPQIAQSAVANMISAEVIPANLSTSENGWNSAIQLRIDVGDVKQGDGTFSQYVDNSYAEKAQ